MAKGSGKPVSASAVNDHIYKIFPNDLNSRQTAFGGLVMSISDRLAAVVAERHSGIECVTASVDSMHFLAPATRGEVLIFQAAVNCTWRTSMEIGIRVIAENYHTGKTTHILSAYFTFVGLDEHNKPTPIPSIIPETPLQERRKEEAEHRRTFRKKAAAEIRSRRKT